MRKILYVLYTIYCSYLDFRNYPLFSKYYMLFFCSLCFLDLFKSSSLSFDFRENLCKTPNEDIKNSFFFFAPCVLFGFVRAVAALIRFSGKFILVWFPRKSMQNLEGKPKKLFFFAPCVFWICLSHCRPHSIFRKIQSCLISEKIHAKPQRKT